MMQPEAKSGSSDSIRIMASPPSANGIVRRRWDTGPATPRYPRERDRARIRLLPAVLAVETLADRHALEILDRGRRGLRRGRVGLRHPHDPGRAAREHDDREHQRPGHRQPRRERARAIPLDLLGLAE